MTKGNYNVRSSRTEGGEITLADVVGFLQRNWKLVLLLTALFSVATVAVLLLLPKNYQKNLTLTTDLSPTSELLSRVDRTVLPTQDQISVQAVSALRSAGFAGVELEPAYNNQTKLLQVTMQSRDKNALARATDEIPPLLEEDLSEHYLSTFDDILELRNTHLEGEEEKMRNALARVEQMSNNNTSLADDQALVQLAVAEAELESTEQLREDLLRLTDEAFSVQILDQTGVARIRTPAALFFLAVAGSLAAALALAFLWEVLLVRRRR